MNSEKVIPVGAYVMVFIALIALTATTTAVAFIDLGAPWNTAVALAIAIVKALLVILFFMHVLHSRPLTWVFVGAGFFWLIILFTFTLADYATRVDIGGASLTGASRAAEEKPRTTPDTARRISNK